MQLKFDNIPPKKNFLYNLKTNKDFLISIQNISVLEQFYNFRVVKNKDSLTFKNINYQIFDMTPSTDNSYTFRYITEGIKLDDVVSIGFKSTMGWAVLSFLFEECCEDMSMYEKLEEALKECL